MFAGCAQGQRSEPPASANESGAENEGFTATDTASSSAVPQRPRFTYVPRAYPSVRINASKLSFELVDHRPNVQAAQLMLPVMAIPKDGEMVEVALPADYPALIQDRLAKVVAGTGPELKLTIEVRRLAASRNGDTRRLDVDLAYEILDANGNPLVRGGGQGNKDLLGPPYDSRELDDLHHAACADALDVMLASESNIALINSYLTGH